MVAKRACLLAMWICIAGLLASCASTRVIGGRRNPEYRGGPVASVLVVVVSDAHEVRRSLEAAFVREFRRRGAAAEGSFDTFGVGTPTTPRDAAQAAERIGAAAVFLARLLEAREQQSYTSPIYYDRQFIQGKYEYVYSPTMTGYVLREGFYTTYQIYCLDSALYSAKAGKLIWSARSETADPAAAEQAMANLATALAEHLKKHALFP